MSTILQLTRITKTYHPRGRPPVVALRETDLSLATGEIRTVVGPSGSGKSTLLLCAGGLLRPETGTVSLIGQDLYQLSSEQRSIMRARHVGFVFQQFHLTPFLSVLDNVLTPALTGCGGRHLRERAAALIERFGLALRRDHSPAELSVGERQRVALARALLLEPQLILADEPTGNLDQPNGQLVMAALAEFTAQGGAVLLATHDQRLVGDENTIVRLHPSEHALGQPLQNQA